MSFSNFHTHSYFCDGHGDPEEYIQKAIQCDFTCLGFSSHAPLPFTNSWTMKNSSVNKYLKTILHLRKKYENRIQIYLGLEIDYITDLISPTDEQFKNMNLDYTIGSVHMIKNDATGKYLAVDGEEDEYLELITSAFHNDIKAFVHNYYHQIQKMVIEKTPSIVGHLDLIKKHNTSNKYFDENEDWYKCEILETLKVIAEHNTILEMNTGGKVRSYTKDFYPSNWILPECKKLNIPLILNSDAHNPQYVNAYFDEATHIMKSSGYKDQHILLNNIWQTVPL